MGASFCSLMEHLKGAQAEVGSLPPALTKSKAPSARF